MGKSWLPLADAALLTHVQNMSTLISATPGAFGLLPIDATQCASLLATFADALTVAKAPETRSPVSVLAKEVAKAALVADVRGLAKRIQANPTVTPVQKENLGIPVQKTTVTKIGKPVTKPLVSIVQIAKGRVVTIRLVDSSTPEKRAKVFGVEGAQIYSYVQVGTELPPTDLEKWRCEGIATRNVFDIGYNAEDVGKTVFIRAVWFSPTGELGPASDEVTATIAA